MRIVHFSDWHGDHLQLPEADMYVCTGDMLPNFPEIIAVEHPMGSGGPLGWSRSIVTSKEQRLQREWFAQNYGQFNETWRSFLGSPDAPVVCVRGNHDFIDLAPLFGGEVYEIHAPENVYNRLGLKIGGFRGIPYICGEWSDELHGPDLDDTCRRLPSLDLIVTHTPPANVLDMDGRPGPWARGKIPRYGTKSLASYFMKMSIMSDIQHRLSCFGHVHGSFGFENNGGQSFSNAACGYNVIERTSDGWKLIEAKRI